METRCMTACIGQIRMQGLVKMNQDGTWAEDRYNPLYYMVHVAKVALPLYPQFGTEPNGYYIPPRWVPRNYLKQMFGPGVDQAIERYSYPDRELLACCSFFAVRTGSSTATKSRKEQKFTRPPCAGAKSPCTTTP